MSSLTSRSTAKRPAVDDKVFAFIDLDTMRGLEIGALHNPRLPVDHPNSYFLDHATSDEIRAKYAQDPYLTAQEKAAIVDVDYVCRPGMRLRDAVGVDARFDFVVASHVIEHIPNPIGWFQQLAEILRPAGIVSLAVPDKRYCFDARREVTAAAQWIDAYLRDLDQPSYEQIYDFEVNYIGDVADGSSLWAGVDPASLQRKDVDDPDAYAYERCLARRDGSEYLDIHCSTFTPESFVDLIDAAGKLGLLPFEVARAFPTQPPSLEFHVSLVRPGEPISRERSRPPRTPPTRREQHPVALSPRELRLVMAKRRLMEAVRSLRSRIP
jgi:SAM-dependent methyltransferase